MTQGRNRIVVLLTAITLTALGSWSATQWVAAKLGHVPDLGEPWFRISGQPVYPPWALFVWWPSLGAQSPRVFDMGGLIAAGGGLAAALVAMVARMSGKSATSTVHGSARWATEDDARAAGLRANDGVFLGWFAGRYLRHGGPEHVMIFAPTRSGKGVGLVVPTLLTWTHSVVVHDIKGEHWQLTSGWRSRFSHCLYFDPTNARSAANNPLLEVRRGAQEVRDVQNIADLLVDPEGALERRNHWEKTSHALLVGAILHVLYAEPDKSLCGVANFLSDPARPIERTLAVMMRTPHLGDRPHPVVASAAREMLNRSDNERSGVLSTAMSFLGLYRDPTVAAVTSHCDWRITDLMTAASPVSLYIVVPPSDLERTRPLVRLLLNQIGRRLTETLPPRLELPGQLSVGPRQRLPPLRLRLGRQQIAQTLDLGEIEAAILEGAAGKLTRLCQPDVGESCYLSEQPLHDGWRTMHLQLEAVFAGETLRSRHPGHEAPVDDLTPEADRTQH